MATAPGALSAALTARLPHGTSLRIGTRNSPMARWQAVHVAALLTRHAPVPIDVEIVGMETSADLWLGDLSRLGGKGNFTKEIDHALVEGHVDIAVHCIKDVPGDVPLPEGTGFGAYLPRDDVHDVLVTRDGTKFADLPPGSVIGTSSVRRRAQLGLHRPDLRTERVRGNVNSRLAKLDAEDSPYDALILALSGLQRLGLDAERVTDRFAAQFVDPAVPAMVPAVGSGVLGIQARTDDAAVLGLLALLNDDATDRCVRAERAMLGALGGHCNSPIAGYCAIGADGHMALNGMVFDGDGSTFVRAYAVADGDPEELGAAVAADLLGQGAARLIEATRH